MPLPFPLSLFSPIWTLAVMGLPLISISSPSAREVGTYTDVTRNPTEASANAGLRQITAFSHERGRDLDVTVWYPAVAGGKKVTLGESVFFQGTPAFQDAAIEEGRYPLIVLSHGAGLGGNPGALSWIAAPLARAGFVVAAPMHPGNSGRQRSAAETMRLWLRPGDLSATIDEIERNLVLRQHVDIERVGVLGLSMGGNSALAIAGARADPVLLAGYCDTNKRNISLCEWVKQSGVDLHDIDMRSAGRDNRDRRIRFAMAIDPAPIDVFDSGRFSEITIPIDIVNLGHAGELPVTTDASRAAKVIPRARYATIGDASHYSMFAECKPGAGETPEAKEIGDPICSDRGGRSRNELHAELIDTTIAAFERALKSGSRSR